MKLLQDLVPGCNKVYADKVKIQRRLACVVLVNVKFSTFTNFGMN